MFWRSLHVLLLITVPASAAFAQIDRARDAPYADFIRYHNDVVKYAEGKDRTSAVTAIADLRRAFGAVFGFSQDVPRHLSDGNLRDLSSQAQAFVDALKDYSGKLQSLEDRLKRIDESYSSELSSLNSSRDNVREKFNVIWESLQRAGKAVKASCMSGCVP
jgi:hypothetical protein